MILQNSLGTIEVVKAINRLNLDGGSFEDLSQKELKKLNLKGGIRLKEIRPGMGKSEQPGFIITMEIKDLSKT